jgi:hypothetical protein
MDCQFCRKSFSSKSNLSKHQQTTKYCIKLQPQNKPKSFICSGCNKELSTKQRLETHIQVCINYLDINRIKELEKIIETKDTIIDELKTRIRELELDMKDVAIKAKSKTTNNNISIQQQNFTAITDENLAQDARKLTLEHIVGGGETIASVFLDGSLKNNALCTDISRRILYLKDEEGNLIKDPNAITITKRAFSSLIGHAKEIKNKCRENIDTDDDDQIETLAKAMSVVGEIGQTISGKSTEVSTDFAKAVCHGSTN